MLNDLKGFFRDEDRAYLSDGWGDVILILGGKPEKRLREVFEIQRVLYEDFQVERTELMLTPQCVETAACNKNRVPEFYVRVIARLLNNRTLEQDNANFVTSLESIIMAKGNKMDYVLTRIPGLSDYDLRFEPTDNEEIARDLYERILEGFLTGKSVDRWRTIIGKVIPK